MKHISKSIVLVITIFLFNCSSEKKGQWLKLNGKVIDTSIASVLLVKPGQFLDSDSLIEIPVVNGKFQYNRNLEFPEAVELFVGKARNVGGRPMPLFLENTNINLTIYSEDDFDKNIVEGGTFNNEYKKYKNETELKFWNKYKAYSDSISLLIEKDKYYTSEMKAIQSKLKDAKNHDEKIVLREERNELSDNGLHLTTEGLRLEDKRERIAKKQNEWTQDYINENPSLVSYFLLLRNLVFREKLINVIAAKQNLENLSKAYPNHPYNKQAFNLIEAIDNIKTGKKYIDFTAPDLNGNKIKLSDEIDGQITLLDLWATWCGPCIAKTRTMVPLYDEYKDKGFVIIGVAGERKNTDRMVKFLEKEKWSWLNLVELDGQNNIWKKYNVDGGGGGMFLLDEDGNIIAINPTAEKVRQELESRLK